MSIQFNPRIPRLPDLLAQTGFDYCGAVEFPGGCARVCCFALANIVRYGPNNCLKGRKGVYVVADADRALYVGSSTEVNANWDLKERIAQHFREKDSGGTLRKNWERAHPGCNYSQFVQRMQDCHLQVISFGNAACNQQVLRLEHLLYQRRRVRTHLPILWFRWTRYALAVRRDCSRLGSSDRGCLRSFGRRGLRASCRE